MQKVLWDRSHGIFRVNQPNNDVSRHSLFDRQKMLQRFADRGAGNEADDRFEKALQADEREDEGDDVHTRHHLLNKWSAAKAQHQGSHKKERVEKRAAKARRAEGKELCPVNFMQRTEKISAQQPCKQAREEAGHKRKKRIDRKKGTAEGTRTETGAEACQTKYAAEDRPFCRAKDNGADDDRDHQKCDFQPCGPEIAERRVRHDELERDKYGQTCHPADIDCGFAHIQLPPAAVLCKIQRIKFI